MKYSICIPNYNYERYLGRTISSVLSQTYPEFEILVSDNSSTDGSVELVRKIGDPRIKLAVNRCNVGFAANLDRAARLASGERMIMLSSDDLMRPEALATYQRLYEHLGAAGERVIVSSGWDVIDGQDNLTGQTGPDRTLWFDADRDEALGQLLGGPVYSVPAAELLKRCLGSLRTPFNFAATVYSAALYREVEGYGAGRLFNPDKWFHWKVLAVAERAYFVDRQLFAYRWHGENQADLESATSALKYLVDQYVSTLELDGKLLERLGLSREDVAAAFIEYDIARHGLATLARGQRLRARRILNFGRATYPHALGRNRRARFLRALLALGPLGQRIATQAYARYQQDVRPSSTE